MRFTVLTTYKITAQEIVTTSIQKTWIARSGSVGFIFNKLHLLHILTPVISV